MWMHIERFYEKAFCCDKLFLAAKRFFFEKSRSSTNSNVIELYDVITGDL